MKSDTRFLIGALLTVLVLAGLAAAGVVLQTRSATRERLLQHLQTAASTESDLQATRIGELQLRAHGLATDPAFVDYVAQALIPDPNLGGAIDNASISNLLDERRKGYDSAIVLDPRGKLVARSGQLLRRNTDFQHDALVRQTLSKRVPSAGLWSGHAQLAWVAVEPLMRGNVLQGVLIASTHLGDDFALSVARISRTDIAMLVPAASGATVAASSPIGSLISTALSGRAVNPLGVTSHAGQQLRIPVQGETVRSWVTPLDTADGKSVMVAMSPVASTSPWLPHDAHALLIGVMLLALIATLLVYGLWARTHAPMQHMQVLILRAAEGEKFVTLRGKGSVTVSGLREAINKLLRHYER